MRWHSALGRLDYQKLYSKYVCVVKAFCVCPIHVMWVCILAQTTQWYCSVTVRSARVLINHL